MLDANSTVLEGFRQIQGYPRYAIDENGAVISICGHRGSTNRSWSDAIRVTSIVDKHGYHCVNLYCDGKMRQIRTHKLVLLTFIGPRPNGMMCRHLDGCKDNNHVSNLAWGTSRENEQDKISHGTYGIGEKNADAKLKVVDVLEIRRRAANGERNVDIAKDFPVTPINISKIVQRRTWKHI